MKKTYKRVICDTSIVNLIELAAFTGRSRASLYRDIADGYAPEFGRRGTTPQHYKDWMRAQAAAPTDETRVARELCGLR